MLFGLFNVSDPNHLSRTLYANHAAASKLDIHQMCPIAFPLPGLSTRLAAFKKTLHQGVGFFTIRGLIPSKYSDLENILIHAAIVSYIGNRRALQQKYNQSAAEALRKGPQPKFK
jgi:hypothetical protein